MSGSVRWMFHATAFSRSYDDLFGGLARLFGCRVLHDQASDAPGVGRRGGMTWIGDNSIEIGEPYGSDSPLRGFLERFGGGMHSVAVQVDDVPATMERVAAMGVEVAAAVSPEIVFTRPAGTCGLLFEWASHVQEDDPRWGAPVPPFTQEPIVDVVRLAYVGGVVADPAADGRRLAALLDTDLTVLDDDRVVLALGDCALMLGPLEDQPRPRYVTLGLLVADVDAAAAALADAGAAVSREGREATVVAAGIPMPVVLVDQLLPGDPRA